MDSSDDTYMAPYCPRCSSSPAWSHCSTGSWRRRHHCSGQMCYNPCSSSWNTPTFPSQGTSAWPVFKLTDLQRKTIRTGTNSQREDSCSDSAVSTNPSGSVCHRAVSQDRLCWPWDTGATRKHQRTMKRLRRCSVHAIHYFLKPVSSRRSWESVLHRRGWGWAKPARDTGSHPHLQLAGAPFLFIYTF